MYSHTLIMKLIFHVFIGATLPCSIANSMFSCAIGLKYNGKHIQARNILPSNHCNQMRTYNSNANHKKLTIIYDLFAIREDSSHADKNKSLVMTKKIFEDLGAAEIWQKNIEPILLSEKFDTSSSLYGHTSSIATYHEHWALRHRIEAIKCFYQFMDLIKDEKNT